MWQNILKNGALTNSRSSISTRLSPCLLPLKQKDKASSAPPQVSSLALTSHIWINDLALLCQEPRGLPESSFCLSHLYLLYIIQSQSHLFLACLRTRCPFFKSKIIPVNKAQNPIPSKSDLYSFRHPPEIETPPRYRAPSPQTSNIIQISPIPKIPPVCRGTGTPHTLQVGV